MGPAEQRSEREKLPALQSENVFRMLVEGVRDYAIFLLDA